MEYTFTRDPDQPYLYIALNGPFDLNRLESCYQAMLARPDWRPGTNVLWDARACSFAHLDQDDVRAIAAMTRKYREQRGRGRAAWLVREAVDYGISRMFQLANEGQVVFHFQVFRSLNQARAWLLDPLAKAGSDPAADLLP